MPTHDKDWQNVSTQLYKDYFNFNVLIHVFEDLILKYFWKGRRQRKKKQLQTCIQTVMPMDTRMAIQARLHPKDRQWRRRRKSTSFQMVSLVMKMGYKTEFFLLNLLTFNLNDISIESQCWIQLVLKIIDGRQCSFPFMDYE